MNIKGSAWLIPPLTLIPKSSHWGLLAWSFVEPFVLPGFSTRPETSRYWPKPEIVKVQTCFPGDSGLFHSFGETSPSLLPCNCLPVLSCGFCLTSFTNLPVFLKP
ncbi:rCG22252 [Rattus norvegicus]|uniref:RCG22252 n=1 Tax=Rattus norvegicus TaxID=10116 RepID=A6IPE0_RAT|nr:rCG22252 [Rattus norvegicus]